MSEHTLKEIAEMKQAFLKSEFGQLVAQKITEIHGGFHEDAEKAATMEQKASLIDKAAGVNEVIRFFTSDVALLEQGYFEENKEAEKAS